MRPDPCAVLFDLDDTLYPRRRFLLSGFAAVAASLERFRAMDRRVVFATLARAHRTAPGRELQALVEHVELPPWMVPQLVEVIRAHEPRLRLPRASSTVLAALRPHWRLGIVTNGPPDIQARKVAALGVSQLVDTVVYAQATGSGGGKPDRAPFVEAMRRLGVRPNRAVFVGDDPIADVVGARCAGLAAVFLRPAASRGRRPTTVVGDATIDSIVDVPSVAMGLIDGRRAYVG